MILRMTCSLVTFLLIQTPFILAQCPFSGKSQEPKTYDKTLIQNYAKACDTKQKSVDYNDVMGDLYNLMTDSQDFWPADYGHYGPFFIRLAWHNAGSYRTSDGRGGADGGRQRFEPERSWADNTQLDKARRLLWPIKQKYGNDLSWGDLFVLAGNAAITHMGGHVLGFCGGRVDVADGSESIQLGPSDIQRELFPCDVNGTCQEPLGANTVGLIYVNPAGHMGDADPVGSAKDIRDVFGRMDMNDTETVALIGGGHAVGKCHGACPAGAGPSPAEDPFNPWPGKCGDGKLTNAYTSGFELPFTSRPIVWDLEYFNNLINYKWKKITGPGDQPQWEPELVGGQEMPQADSADGNSKQNVGLLTSDVALMNDVEYEKLVRMFAEDRERFDEVFAHAWYKLTTRDMGPRVRCDNNDAPPEQDWQNPLPVRSESVPDFTGVKERIVEILQNDDASYGQFTRLAWQCASSFRVTDYQGGCNGARLRFSPAKDWEVNKNIDATLDKLQTVKTEFGSALSWADLIVLAGTTALEHSIQPSAGIEIPFCEAGRVDDTHGNAWKFLQPRVSGKSIETVNLLKDYIAVMGLTTRQFAALMGAGYALGQDSDCAGLFCNRKSFSGPQPPSTMMSNRYFNELLSNTWNEVTINGDTMYQAEGSSGLMMYKTDLYLKTDPELFAIAAEFAGDQNTFYKELSEAWPLLMNADMYSGPTGNLCGSTTRSSSSNIVISSISILFLLIVFIHV